MKFDKTEPVFIENQTGERAPLSHNLLDVNKFIRNDSVRFEDLQKLSFDLASELSELKQVVTDADDLISRLKRLNYRQLLSVRESLGHILQTKDTEPRVALWIVTNESEDIACYNADQYQAACDKMASLIHAEAKHNPDTPMELHLERRKVRKSEIDIYMDINRN